LKEVGGKLVVIEKESIHKSEPQFILMDKTTRRG